MSYTGVANLKNICFFAHSVYSPLLWVWLLPDYAWWKLNPQKWNIRLFKNQKYSLSPRRNKETANQVNSPSFQHYPVQVLAQNIHLSERHTATTQITVCTSLTAVVCQILLLNKHQQIPLTISLSSDLSLDMYEHVCFTNRQSTNSLLHILLYCKKLQQ